ncbi:MAG: dockerin type I repeat-containing protein [Prevotella sp.]|nr:dockerin type I repeat-containing protein [Prevotella sp.]
MNKFSRILLALLLTCTVSSAAAAETPKGDVNGDTKVTIADVTALVNVILGKTTANAACDVNGDTKVTIADVTALVNIILSKTPPGSDSTDIDDDDPAWEPANARSNDSSNQKDSADRKIWKD